MTLAPLQLDDLTWDDMVAAIRRRIPAESQGNWTLHAPADPGITLLDLFAFLAEQRLYWLDQVPDAFVVAVLRLLGLDGPQPAVPAATVLQIAAAWIRRTRCRSRCRPGTGFTRDPRGEVVFTLDDRDAVTVLPVRSLTVCWRTGRTARPTCWPAARSTCCPRAADPARPGSPWISPRAGTGRAAVACCSTWPSAGHPRAALPSRRLVPGRRRRRAAARRAHLVLRRRHGARYRFDAAQVKDGTQGLRRSGIVRLPVPPSWNSGAGLRTLAAEHRARRRSPPRHGCSSSRSTWPPPGTGRTSATDAGQPDALDRQVSDWLPLPGQHLDLPGRAGPPAGRVADAPGAGRPGTRRGPRCADFVFSGREDRVFVIDRAAGALRFGDGRTGRIPVPDPGQPGKALSSVTWTLGGGIGGNGGTTANWHGTGDAASATAANLVPAAGGADAETIAQARGRAGAALHEVHRAVTAADHETIALKAPGVAVARAHAAVGDHPGFPVHSRPRSRLRLRRARRAARRRRLGPAGFRARPPARSGTAQPGPRRAVRRPGCWARNCSSGNPATARPGCGSR